MENVLINTILKGVGIYIIALLITRSICTKLISQMNFFDFIMGVSMGSIVADDQWSIFYLCRKVVTNITYFCRFGVKLIVKRICTVYNKRYEVINTI